MPILLQVTLHCDAVGCGQWTSAVASVAGPRLRGRDHLRWMRIDRYENESKPDVMLCPEHADEHEAGRPPQLKDG
jgi:hypothetical protein